MAKGDYPYGQIPPREHTVLRLPLLKAYVINSQSSGTKEKGVFH
jgi:hypothetical protein